MRTEDSKIICSFNHAGIIESHRGRVFLAGVFFFLGLMLNVGCFPEKMVIDAAPSGRQSDFQGPPPAIRQDTRAAVSFPKINLTETKNIYVAVMDVNLSPNIAPAIKLPLTMAIIGELVALNKFKVVDRMNRDAILAEQGFQQTGCVDSSCSVQVGRLLGVNRIVVGSVNLIGDKHNINIQVLNVETGQIEAVSEKSVSCKEEDLPGWVKLTVRDLFN